jgi:glucose-6-phosphate 1-dehydrogenase
MAPEEPNGFGSRATAVLENPLARGLSPYRNLTPAVMVIFGATGDLCKRKLLPALYELFHERLLPVGFALLGAAKDQLSDDQYRSLALAAVREHTTNRPVDEEALALFCRNLSYQPLEFSSREGFQKLRKRLAELDGERQTGGNVLFYCATPPAVYTQIVQQLAALGLHRGKGYRRIVVEKPFGEDLESARYLNRVLREAFPEESIFRIDHYLGKETVQNILAFRFANAIFEPIWNSQYVDHVQITVAEPIGIEGRASYYERAGALRDIVQNHAFQLLSLVAMEPPIAFDATSVRDEKVKVLKAVRPLTPEEVATNTVRGQYGRGWVLGREVPAYREEPGVAPDSETETHAALRLQVDNWRWADLPFYIRTGKRLARRATEIRVQFRRPPHLTFGREATRDLEPNSITLRIQPEEAISLRFGAKVPSPGVVISSVNMDFTYASSFQAHAPDAYARLILDCMAGDPTLFTRSDEVEWAWSIIDPIEACWREGRPPLEMYPAGTWGPEAANRLMERDGRQWHVP